MRIAFVGKGGSGKTTLAALFIHSIHTRYPVLAIDADLNMHLGPLLGFSRTLPPGQHLSHPDAVRDIKTYLKGENARIRDLAHFRKTTPPTASSGFVVLGDSKDPLLSRFGAYRDNVCLLTVGTYDTDEIGASCYHNNLAILENILSHLIDSHGVVVADMVAGVDAFANTLHAQFDMLVLVVEPTRRGIEVFTQYQTLSEEAGVYDHLFIVGNKIRCDADAQFLKSYIPEHKLIGFLRESDYLRRKDREGGALDVGLLEKENQELLRTIEKKLFTSTPHHNARLKKLFELHKKYVAQDFIRERFGDLTDQIDTTFNMEDFIRKHGNHQ